MLMKRHGYTRYVAHGGDSGNAVAEQMAPQALPEVGVLPHEIYAAPRSWPERAYGKLISFNKLVKGGYFAAWQQPKLLNAEIRAAFRSVRQSI